MRVWDWGLFSDWVHVRFYNLKALHQWWCCRQSEPKRALTPSLILSTLRKPLRKPLFTHTQEFNLGLCTQLCLTSSQLQPYRKFMWEGGVPCEVTPSTILFAFKQTYCKIIVTFLRWSNMSPMSKCSASLEPRPPFNLPRGKNKLLCISSRRV